MSFKTDRRLYFTADRLRVVEEGDPEAAYLYLGKNHYVTDADAKRYGLHPPVRTEITEVKQVDAPPENKAVAMSKVGMKKL